jgi:hypothetical protein
MTSRFVDDSLPAMAVLFIHVHGQLDRLLRPPQIPCMLVQTRQYKTSEVTLNKYLIRFKSIDAYLPVTHKNRNSDF